MSELAEFAAARHGRNIGSRMQLIKTEFNFIADLSNVKKSTSKSFSHHLTLNESAYKNSRTGPHHE